MKYTHEELSQIAMDQDGPMKSAICKYCGSKGVEWFKVDGKWFLVDTYAGRLQKHFCQQSQDAYANSKEGKKAAQQKIYLMDSDVEEAIT